MKDSDTKYEFSYEVESVRHEFWETPDITEETVPLAIFSHASTIQAVSRYLVDEKGLSFTDAARLLNRSPKSIWTSYHQTEPLPPVDTDSLGVPVRIFTDKYSPLEALVLFLREHEFTNVAVARSLGLSPKTTHTAWKRAEVKR